MVADIGSSELGALCGGAKSLNFEFSFEGETAHGKYSLQASKRGPNWGWGAEMLVSLEQNIRSLDIVIDLDRWFVFVF